MTTTDHSEQTKQQHVWILGDRTVKKLTLPSETQTNWFCCCWMVSFKAPYHPSFMLFKLMVAKRKQSHN